MSVRPLVVVTTSAHRSRLYPALRAAVQLAGGRPWRLDPRRPRPDWGRARALLLGGGIDVDPSRYGAPRRPGARYEPERDELELSALARAAERDLPVLGICRGAQLMNVAAGGTLHLDLSAVVPGHSPRVRLRAFKPVDVRPDTALRSALGRSRLRVNSIHRQAIDAVGDGLTVSAFDDLGVVQGVERPGASFFVGVQWHPELMLHHLAQRRLLRRFTAAARADRSAET